MELGYLIGWVGAGLGACISLPQLIKILKTGQTANISIATYVILVFAITFYLIHAIYIGAEVFIVTNAVNLVARTTILTLLIRRRG